MVDKLLQNAGTVVALAFAGVGLLLLVVVVVAGLFGIKLDQGTFDLLKMITVSSMGYGIGSGAQAAAARAQQARALAAAQADPNVKPMWDGDKWVPVRRE